MTFIHVTLEDSEPAESGVKIRNRAIFDSVSKFAFGQSVCLKVQKNKKSYFSRRHPTVASLNDTEIEQLVAKIKAADPAFVIFEGVPLLEAVNAVQKALPELWLIADFHNIEGLLFKEFQQQRLPKVLRFLAPFLFAKRIQMAIEADRKLIDLVNQLWVCSQNDFDILEKQTTGIAVDVIPNPIPSWCAVRKPLVRHEANEILFLGHLGYLPNKTAVRELCLQIFPKVRSLFPGAVLHIAGRNPNKRLLKLIQTAGGLTTKNPIELNEIYERAAVTAIPLRSGGGTRIKVLEALAIGLPIVATPKAVESLGLTPAIHFLEAGTSEEFSQAITNLLKDREFAFKLAENGQAYVFSKFSNTAITASVERALNNVNAFGRH